MTNQELENQELDDNGSEPQQKMLVDPSVYRDMGYSPRTTIDLRLRNSTTRFKVTNRPVGKKQSDQSTEGTPQGDAE